MIGQLKPEGVRLVPDLPTGWEEGVGGGKGTYNYFKGAQNKRFD